MLIYRNAEGVYGQRTFENPWSKMLHKFDGCVNGMLHKNTFHAQVDTKWSNKI